MTPAQAADTLAALPASDVDVILALIDTDEARKIVHLLEHHDDKIANFATERFIAFPPDAEIRHVLDQYRALAKDADIVMYVYVVDKDNRLIGGGLSR